MTSRQRLVNISSFIIWCAYAFVQTAILWWYDYDREISLNDSLISATVLAVACFIISNALNYYLPSRKHYFYVAIWALVLAAATLSLSRWILNLIISDQAYLNMVDQSLPLRYLFHTLTIAWMATINIVWNIQQDYKETEQRKTDAERLAREAELYNLRQQLQPHFLFNSLNSIIALIQRQPQKAREMTFQLSDFLRGTLRKDDQQFIALSDELGHLMLYLEIEKVRFGHRLETDIQRDEQSERCLLPAMVLQPILENAIKFGLYDTTDPVKIEVSSQFDPAEGMLIIQVRNPYDPAGRVRKGTGFGLRGVQRRLFLLFGRTDLLETVADERLFTTTIKIPQAQQA